MTSANKKPAYYDFKHSYQYPMNGYPMENSTKHDNSSSHKSAETKKEIPPREENLQEKKGLQAKTTSRKVGRVPKEVAPIKRKKILFAKETTENP